MRYLTMVLAFGGLLFVSGCGDSSDVGKTFPVSGKIYLDNRPLTATTTTVLFKPDASKGNTSTLEPAGTLDDNGTYRLLTKGKEGAPPGWYKVIVTAIDPKAPLQTGKRREPAPRSLVPGKYGQAGTSDLVIEVVESPQPGAYDLKLTQ